MTVLLAALGLMLASGYHDVADPQPTEVVPSPVEPRLSKSSWLRRSLRSLWPRGAALFDHGGEPRADERPQSEQGLGGSDLVGWIMPYCLAHVPAPQPDSAVVAPTDKDLSPRDEGD